MTITLDSAQLWMIAGGIVLCFGFLLRLLAHMIITGIYKKIAECQAQLKSDIESVHNIAVRAHTRIDDVLGHSFRVNGDVAPPE